MPLYTYRHPTTGQTKDVFQGMNDEHSYSEDGVEWMRVFTKPYAAIDTEIDPFSSKSFIDKTANKKGTLGDMWERSAELSETREKKAGVDPVKQNFYADYKKKTGKEYLDLRPKKIETQGMTVDFSN